MSLSGGAAVTAQTLTLGASRSTPTVAAQPLPRRALAHSFSSASTCGCVIKSAEPWGASPPSCRFEAPSTSAPSSPGGLSHTPSGWRPGRRPQHNNIPSRLQAPAASGRRIIAAGSSNNGNGDGDSDGSTNNGTQNPPLPVVDPVVLDEYGKPSLQQGNHSSSGSGSIGLEPGSSNAAASREAGGRSAAPALDCAPARWTAVLQLPPVMWGLSWLLTAGPVSVAYACLAAASVIAATVFGGLLPGPAGAAGATAAAAGTAGAAGAAAAAPPAAAATAATAATAAAAAAAAVDWLDVALRTANGLAAGGAARAQVLQALQEAGAGSLGSWAVQVLLPALCGAASGARGLAVALQPADLVLGALSQLSSVAAGLGVLLVMGLPLRPYLAPLLPVLPRGRPSPATMAALRAGGVACMVAALTGLQAAEVTTPELGRSVRSAAAAAAAGVPLLAQMQACLYGAFAVAADVLVAAATAIVAARAAAALWHGGAAGSRSGTASAPVVVQGSRGVKAEVEVAAAESVQLRRVLTGARWLGAGRLALDVLLLAAMACGGLSAHVSAVRLLGMLWLFQTARQVSL